MRRLSAAGGFGIALVIALVIYAAVMRDAKPRHMTTAARCGMGNLFHPCALVDPDMMDL